MSPTGPTIAFPPPDPEFRASSRRIFVGHPSWRLATSYKYNPGSPNSIKSITSFKRRLGAQLHPGTRSSRTASKREREKTATTQRRAWGQAKPNQTGGGGERRNTTI